jgi:heme/copper-type cytochrome/quinol oxidase subunit 3
LHLGVALAERPNGVNVSAPDTGRSLKRDDSLARGHEWWGLAFGLAALFALLASLIVSWFYLRFAAAAWPIDAEPLALDLALVATAIAVGALGAALACGWSASRSRRRGLVGATAGLTVLAAALLGVLGAEIAGAELRATADARASLFYVLLGFVVAVASVGLLLAGGVAMRALRGDFTREHHVAVQMLTTWWYFVVVAWLAVFATVYVAERVLDGG